MLLPRGGTRVKSLRENARMQGLKHELSALPRTDDFNGMTRGAGPSPFSITTMKRFFNKIKRKESPKPPHQPILSEEPADIASEPPDIRPEVDVLPDGGQNPPYEGLEADRADLAVPQNEGKSMRSRMSSQDKMDGDQQLPASGASTSGVAIGGELASKCS